MRREGPSHPRLPPGAARGRVGSRGLGREAGASLVGPPLSLPSVRLSRATAAPGQGWRKAAAPLSPRRSREGGKGSAVRGRAEGGGGAPALAPGRRRCPPPSGAAPPALQVSPALPPALPCSASPLPPARRVRGASPGGTGNPAASRAARRGSASLTPPGQGTAWVTPTPGPGSAEGRSCPAAGVPRGPLRVRGRPGRALRPTGGGWQRGRQGPGGEREAETRGRGGVRGRVRCLLGPAGVVCCSCFSHRSNVTFSFGLRGTEQVPHMPSSPCMLQ